MIVSLTLSPGALPGLADGLRARGLLVREAPLLAVRPVPDLRSLDTALRRLEPRSGLAVTSPRAGHCLRQRVQAMGAAIPREVWAVGPATVRSLPPEWNVRLSPEANARSLAEAMLEAGVRGPVLHPCGTHRREELSLLLGQAGIAVQPIICYDVVLAEAAEIHVALDGAALVLAGSHRVIRRMAEVTGTGVRPGLVCLGPATAATARAAGWEPAAVAGEPTARGFLQALDGKFTSDRRCHHLDFSEQLCSSSSAVRADGSRAALRDLGAPPTLAPCLPVLPWLSRSDPS